MAIFPVLGSFLIIQAQRNDSIFSSNIVAQKLGAWSYSIYLWHWPLVVAIYYYSLTQAFIYVGLALSVLLGFLSNKYVEKIKFENDFKSVSSYLKCKPVYIFFTIGLLGCVVKFTTFTHNQTLSNILGHNYFNSKGELIFNHGQTTILFNDIKSIANIDILMLGDSNSAHYSYGITASNNLKVAHRWVGSCLPFISSNTKATKYFQNDQWKLDCNELYTFVDKNKNVPVVISNSWSDREIICTKDCSLKSFYFDYNVNLRNELKKVIKYIGDRPIFIIGTVPAPIESMVNCMRGMNSQFCERTTSRISKYKIKMNDSLSKFSSEYENVFFINPFKSICNDIGECRTIIEDENLFYDGSHLSGFGSEIIWQYIESEIIKTLDLKIY